MSFYLVRPRETYQYCISLDDYVELGSKFLSSPLFKDEKELVMKYNSGKSLTHNYPQAQFEGYVRLFSTKVLKSDSDCYDVYFGLTIRDDEYFLDIFQKIYMTVGGKEITTDDEHPCLFFNRDYRRASFISISNIIFGEIFPKELRKLFLFQINLESKTID